MIFLELQAPFGVFRPFTCGTYRPTAAFITPSAAYGLLLNVAGIEMRHADGGSPVTKIASSLPRMRLSLAALDMPGPVRQSLFQQLHTYPVGGTGKEHAARAMGRKCHIVPVRREFLSNVRAYIGVDATPGLEESILAGLSGKSPRRYGLPFLGDNNFLIDRLEPVEKPKPAYWLEKIGDGKEGMRGQVMRLTITIDRTDSSKSRSALFATSREKKAAPPPESWIEIGYP
ncbi:MAG: type I-MYXAN CRISPR-associated protein Cas5/Cmx5/DevS [Deltaproteobacteria bacterium]|nr:type I-MYXAN CRISPR-associated protein Cas5/Cmx5/DevS [Deltaproteobacteria bacterium]